MIASDPSKQDIWKTWIDEYIGMSEPIPLFATDNDGYVKTKTHGRDNRPVLKRSHEMETLLRSQGWKVVEDWQDSRDVYEGLIYLMFTLDGSEVVPRYIGKAGKYGRDGEGLSANLKNVRTNNTKLARWGDGYAYHIGELSAAVLNHHTDEAVNREKDPIGKYQKWADALFVDGTRQLKEPVYYWTTAWRTDDTGPFYGFETSLKALEYNLINLAADVYPDELLNSEGA